MIRTVGSILTTAALALTATALSVAPSQAATSTPVHKPKVTIEDVDFTIHLKPGEACRFPVTIHGEGRSRTTEYRDKVVTETLRGSYAKVTRDNSHREFVASAVATFTDRVFDDGNTIRGRGKGHQFFWGDSIAFENWDRGPRPGFFYIEGRDRYRIDNAKDDDGGDTTFTDIDAHVTDICRVLSGHRKH